jgi:hypothetical protein
MHFRKCRSSHGVNGGSGEQAIASTIAKVVSSSLAGRLVRSKSGNLARLALEFGESAIEGFGDTVSPIKSPNWVYSMVASPLRVIERKEAGPAIGRGLVQNFTGRVPVVLKALKFGDEAFRAFLGHLAADALPVTEERMPRIEGKPVGNVVQRRAVLLRGL